MNERREATCKEKVTRGVQHIPTKMERKCNNERDVFFSRFDLIKRLTEAVAALHEKCRGICESSHGGHCSAQLTFPGLSLLWKREWGRQRTGVREYCGGDLQRNS